MKFYRHDRENGSTWWACRHGYHLHVVQKGPNEQVGTPVTNSELEEPFDLDAEGVVEVPVEDLPSYLYGMFLGLVKYQEPVEIGDRAATRQALGLGDE